ncbi:NADP-dependent isocitrate dehydrogenase [Paraburkholderia sp. ZP32-5]|uniref:NADP-dependent isocitrate dehydrogenase n=1 Tax=Paraburkholderia sp. ZP32-5 TaxID=2883245 RepID=UPI001F2A694C|nr:NADP-dependent isocitrate dehydrogenase [Paraburkholderia sp. ZP32-5]
MSNKIKVGMPLVEMQGDEMARIMWEWVRDRLILPFVDVELVQFDLGIENRERTDDKVTHEAAQAAKTYGVALKCSTITPDRARQQEFGLTRLYPSPNGTIRNALDGTLFREPLICANVPRGVAHWDRPVVIARHAFGEQYRAKEIVVDRPGTVKLVFEPEDGGEPIVQNVHAFSGNGVALGIFNTDESIRGFARACLNFGLQRGYPVYFSHKATVLKQYDGRFMEIFAEEFEAFEDAYRAAGLVYEARLIDDMVAFSLKSTGGYLWACKNYDGDVQSDYLAQGYGSPGLMTSVLMSPDGRYVLTETAHGTAVRHYRQFRDGEPTSSNPLATIVAWTRALAQRGRFDGTPEVERFAALLERTCIELVEAGTMTRDLARLIGPRQTYVSAEEFVAQAAQAMRVRVA